MTPGSLPSSRLVWCQIPRKIQFREIRGSDPPRSWRGIFVARCRHSEPQAGRPSLVEGLLEELEWLFHLGLDVRDHAETLVLEHKELADAIWSHDPERAMRVLTVQIESSQSMVLKGVTRGSLRATIP